jgi:hypothetical protein
MAAEKASTHRRNALPGRVKKASGSAFALAALAALLVWSGGFGGVRTAGAFSDMGYSGRASCDDCHGGFHRGGVGRCNGCHTMHNSQNGRANTYNLAGSVGSSTPYLMRAADSTSLCLYCHHDGANYRNEIIDIIVSNPPPPESLTPGGNFGWVRKTFSWEGGSSPGQAHGHNIVAQDFGYMADSRFVRGPGGTYPAETLGCISCHDPHGRYRRLADGSEVMEGPRITTSGSNGIQDPGSNATGAYRLLAGAGYRSSLAPEHLFANRTPVAVIPTYPWIDDGDFGWTPSVNRSEAETDTRVAYGMGTSEWCANCHEAIHNPDYATSLRHPAGNSAGLGSAIAANYNAYLKSGDFSGTYDTSYCSLVPFEMQVTDYPTLVSTAVNSNAGPDASSSVTCLTCHRAHASGWDSIGRWNFNAQMIVYAGSWPGIGNGAPSELSQGRTEAETRLAYYDRPPSKFAAYQRSLCDKCHAKD